MYLIEVTASIDASGNTQKFYLSDNTFVTGPSDTPAHTAFDPILSNPGSIGRSVYSDGRTGGNSKLEIGEISIVNIDGQLDSWLNYSFDGREIVIYKGESGAYPSGFTKIFTGTMDGIELTTESVIIRIRDKAYLFDTNVCKNTYLGNNALPLGLEGTADDIKGQYKPVCYGKVYNISPVLVNTSKLIYQVNDGAISSVDKVYDRRAELTKGTSYSSESDMINNAPTSGYFRVYEAGGYFRLGSTPAGQITADVVQGDTSANRTVAQVLKNIALQSAITVGEIDSSSITALDVANSSEIGIYCDDQTIISAMDEVAQSINAWYGFDADGILKFGQLSAPSSSVLSINDYEIVSSIDRVTPKDVSIPTWKINLNYLKNYTVQDNDFAGSVTSASRAWASEEFRITNSSNSNKTKWKLSQEYDIESLLISSTAAGTEASRMLSLYGTRRDVFRISVDIDSVSGIELMDTVTVIVNRFGMYPGKMLRVIGIDLSLLDNKITLTLWG